MTPTTIRPFHPTDTNTIVSLWRRCGLVVPWNDPDRDIERKLGAGADLFLVAELDDRVVGSVMAGYDGHRGWMYYLAVDPQHQGKGIGSSLVAAVERRFIDLGVPKVNVQIRKSNSGVAGFYHRLGYRPDDVINLGRRLIPDE